MLWSLHLVKVCILLCILQKVKESAVAENRQLWEFMVETCLECTTKMKSFSLFVVFLLGPFSSKPFKPLGFIPLTAHEIILILLSVMQHKRRVLFYDSIYNTQNENPYLHFMSQKKEARWRRRRKQTQIWKKIALCITRSIVSLGFSIL